ncbi:hypothetical protein G4V39_09425 [Thermosulfuriphilus ammonigenes]|uniref:Uncharacterized protein n=1 Tax=Thermosulfuriphilus ammonigenes TaxID=1936021 RepID=A0A6G7PY18_9BACT|nr:hypothetical protein [Thermosulfuriphilus ammonigenes]MBA2849406.1 hypothetical protein [Thermosulfuriphilus ammonigenes]QIJ72477.1 hypothetical protein G4V39_09425 [Thermosulfuriphilus ammonigenes]
MARISIDKALSWVLRHSGQLHPGECLDLLCKKRNRLIRVVRTKEGFRLEERGFFKEDFFTQGGKEFQKLLERLILREFPRSHMLWAFKRRA